MSRGNLTIDQIQKIFRRTAETEIKGVALNKIFDIDADQFCAELMNMWNDYHHLVDRSYYANHMITGTSKKGVPSQVIIQNLDEIENKARSLAGELRRMTWGALALCYGFDVKPDHLQKLVKDMTDLEQRAKQGVKNFKRLNTKNDPDFFTGFNGEKRDHMLAKKCLEFAERHGCHTETHVMRVFKAVYKAEWNEVGAQTGLQVIRRVKAIQSASVVEEAQT